jgi:hypothetical protein
MAIKIEGLDKLIKDLQKFEKDGERVAVRNIGRSATNIEKASKRDAPKYIGDLKLNFDQRIDKIIENRGLSAKVGIQQVRQKGEFAVWYEFGTGLSAREILAGSDYTKEIKDLAQIFFRTGEGTLKGKPYLFPNFFKESPKLIEKLKKDLDNLAKKV